MSRLSAPARIKYLAAAGNELNQGLTVTTAGYQSVPPRSRYPSKEHPLGYLFSPQAGRILEEYQVIYITNGKGSFSSRHAAGTGVTAGTILLLFPGEWHTYLPDAATGWDTYWIGFKGKFAQQILQQYSFNKSSPVFHVGFNENLVRLFRDVIDYTTQEKPGFRQLISAITLHILGITYYIVKNKSFADKGIGSRIEQAKMLMREHITGKIAPQQVAKSLNMGYSWFRRVFKQYTGLSPAAYQQQLKIQQSKEWLVTSDRPVKEIAYLLNFESVNYFISFFKRHTGLTPSVFRQNSRG